MLRPAFENEKEVRVLALSGTFAINLLLLLVLFYVRLWQSTPPQPPRVEFVEVNFGMDRVGSGRIQTHNQPNPSERAEEMKPPEAKPRPIEPPTPQPTRTEAPVSRAKPVAEKPIITSKAESPVTVAEKPPVKRPDAPAPAPVPVAKATPRPEPARPVETVNPNGLYRPKSGGKSGGNGTIGQASGTGGNNNGDDPSGVGDKGDPNGRVDAKGLYGSPNGTASGVSFSVSGWELASNINVSDGSDETGFIVFKIQVDQDGTVVSVRTQQTTVSPSVVDFYRRVVQRARLRPKSSAVAALSTGTVRYNIKSK